MGAAGKPCAWITSTPENITVCLVVSANGQKGFPLVRFKGSYLQEQWQASELIYPGQLPMHQVRRVRQTARYFINTLKIQLFLLWVINDQFF